MDNNEAIKAAQIIKDSIANLIFDNPLGFNEAQLHGAQQLMESVISSWQYQAAIEEGTLIESCLPKPLQRPFNRKEWESLVFDH